MGEGTKNRQGISNCPKEDDRRLRMAIGWSGRMLWLSFITGLVAGTISGITPGLHVNLVAAIAASSKEALGSWFSGFDLAVFIVVMATAHTFLDVIPSIFLGSPSEAYAVAVLPGHRLLRQGAGFEAVRLATAGSLIAGAVAIGISPLLWFVVPAISRMLLPWTPWLVALVMAAIILREKGCMGKCKGAVLFGIAGFLGYLVLDQLALQDPLMPLLSGLFGASSLILALGEESCIPPQFVTECISIPPIKQAVLVSCAVFSGWIVSLLPGVGAGQAAMVSTIMLPTLLPGEYLYLVGGIGTVNFLMAIITAATIGKARNGAVVSVLEIIPKIDFRNAVILSASALAGAGLSALIALCIARIAVKAISKVPYKISCITVLAVVTLAVVWRSGIIGLVVYATGAGLGILCNTSRVSRSSLMACLIVPVIVHYI